ncbi:MAG: ROK family protein [Bacteroidota bacterium]
MRFGMDYGGTNIKAGVFTDDGEAVVSEHVPLRALKEGDLLANLVALAVRVADGHAVTAGGIAIKGLVDTDAGCVVDDVGDGALLAGIDLRHAFGNALAIPFAVENDARAYAWGEWLFGAGRGSTVMACLTLGTGVGCALVAHGAPYVGADALGGILGGHMSIDRTGPECPCGQRGCLELYCSAPAFSARVRAAHPDLTDALVDGSATLPAFFNAVRAQGEPYQATLDAYLDDLAIGVVNVVHAYGPDRVVLGGGVMHSADLLLPGLTARVHDRAWTVPRRRIALAAAAYPDRAAALGAAFHPSLD